jgi:hypothetical protein
MARKLNKNEIEFYNRWTNKANKYNLKEINDVCDKFFTLFVIFNYLYNRANELYAYRYTQDKQKAIKIPSKLLSEQAIVNNITINKNLGTILQLVDDNVFYIVNTDADNRLLNKINGYDLQEKVEALLELVYKIRCNLFHGEKSLDNKQKDILIPCINIFAEINQMMFEKMKV